MTGHQVRRLSWEAFDGDGNQHWFVFTGPNGTSRLGTCPLCDHPVRLLANHPEPYGGGGFSLTCGHEFFFSEPTRRDAP